MKSFLSLYTFTCSLITFVAISRHYRFAYILWIFHPLSKLLDPKFCVKATTTHTHTHFIRCVCALRAHRHMTHSSSTLNKDFSKWGNIIHVSLNMPYPVPVIREKVDATSCGWLADCVRIVCVSLSLSFGPKFSRLVFYISPFVSIGKRHEANESGLGNCSQQFIRPS